VALSAVGIYPWLMNSEIAAYAEKAKNECNGNKEGLAVEERFEKVL